MAHENSSFNRTRSRIAAGFRLFENVSSGGLLDSELMQALRYLGQFPTDERILRAKDSNRDIWTLENFEKLSLSLMLGHDCEPVDSIVMLNAFRTFDKEGCGFLDLELVNRLGLEDIDDNLLSGKFSYEEYTFNFKTLLA